MPDEVIRTDPAGIPVHTAVGQIVKRVSWGAIWAGVMVALGMEALFTLFGLFIGFHMFHAESIYPWAGVPGWATAWYIVTAGWSMFFGAYCAARLSSNPFTGDRIFHGITTWGLATVATVVIAGTISFAVLREGITLLAVAAATAPGAVVAVPANGTTAQATAHLISGLSLRLFIGMLVGFVTAICGGLLGYSRAVAVAPTEEVVPVIPRRAA